MLLFLLFYDTAEEPKIINKNIDGWAKSIHLLKKKSNKNFEIEKRIFGEKINKNIVGVG